MAQIATARLLRTEGVSDSGSAGRKAFTKAICGCVEDVLIEGIRRYHYQDSVPTVKKAPAKEKRLPTPKEKAPAKEKVPAKEKALANEKAEKALANEKAEKAPAKEKAPANKSTAAKSNQATAKKAPAKSKVKMESKPLKRYRASPSNPSTINFKSTKPSATEDTTSKHKAGSGNEPKESGKHKESPTTRKVDKAPVALVVEESITTKLSVEDSTIEGKFDCCPDTQTQQSKKRKELHKTASKPSTNNTIQFKSTKLSDNHIESRTATPRKIAETIMKLHTPTPIRNIILNVDAVLGLGKVAVPIAKASTLILPEPIGFIRTSEIDIDDFETGTMAKSQPQCTAVNVRKILHSCYREWSSAAVVGDSDLENISLSRLVEAAEALALLLH
jgi:hypothetical protein